MASLTTAVLDSDILIPATPRDTLPRAAQHELYQLRWNVGILEEGSATPSFRAM